MKNLINYLSKKSLSLGNGSGMTRKWFEIGSAKSRKSIGPNLSRLCLASLICLCMLTVGVGNVWAVDLKTSDLDFGTPGKSENFNAVNTVSTTGKSGSTTTVTNYTTYGIFTHGYIGKSTSDGYAIKAAADPMTSKYLEITTTTKGAGMSFSHTFATKGAFSFTIAKTSKTFIGLYAAVANSTIYAKANSSVYLYFTGSKIQINSGSGWVDAVTDMSSLPNAFDVTVIYNNTTTADEYGDGVSIGAKRAHIFVNGTAVMNGSSPKDFTIPGTSLTAFRVMYNVAGTSKVDDIKVYDALPTAAGTSVSLSQAASSNGSFSLSTSSVTTTSSSGSVTVTCTPNDGYATSSVSATNPATNPSAITYGGSGNSRTVTYATGANGSSTISVTFACVTPTISSDLSTTQVNYALNAAATALSITASANNATLSYAWEKSANGTSGWTSVGTNSSSYTPSTAVAGDLYYRCTVTNTASGCSTTAISQVAHIHVNAGSTWKFKYSGDGYTAHTMTEATGIASYSLDLAADTRYEFGFDDNGSAFYKNQGTIITTTSGWVFNTSDNNCKIHTGPAGTYTFAINTTTKAVTVTYPTVSHPNDHYVYFKNTDSWGTVKGYLGNTGNDNKAAAWPGSDMQVTTEICGENYYYAALNAMSGTYNVIVFNNGSGSQTSDLSTTGSLGKFNANQDANWHDFKYSITFAGNGNTGGSMSPVSNICIGSNQTLASNGYTKTHYHFTGWIANVDVKIGGATVMAGTLITNAATIQDIHSNITLTAQWAPDEYTISTTLSHVTSSPAIPSSYTYTGSAAGLSYTISANAGYRLPTSITVSGTTYTWNSNTGVLTLTGTITSNVSITITAVQTHKVDWYVGGSAVGNKIGDDGQTTVVDHGGKISNFPATTPDGTPCDKTFVGWTNTTSYVHGTSPLFTDVAGSPQINADANFYAVFATGGSTTVYLTESEISTSFVSGTTTSYGNYTITSASGTWGGKITINKVTISATDVYCVGIRKNADNNSLGSPTFSGNISNITVTGRHNAGSARDIYICSSNATAQPTSGDIGSGSIPAGPGSSVYTDWTDVSITPTGDHTSFYIYANGGLQIKTVAVTYGGYSGYTITCADCGTSVTPTYTAAPTGGTVSVTKSASPVTSGSTVKTCTAVDLTVTLTPATHYDLTGFTATGLTTGTATITPAVGSTLPVSVAQTFTVTVSAGATGTLTLAPTFTAQTPLSITLETHSKGTFTPIGDIYSGESFTFPTVTPSDAECSSFLGWIEGTTFVDDGTETDPTAITGLANYHAAGSSSGTLTTNKTYTAVYGEKDTQVVPAYQKVTSAPSNWSGDYLIVRDDNSRAFDGSLSTLDAADNYIGVTISDGSITANSTVNASKWTIAKVGETSNYTIKSASGYYIGRTANSNGLNSSTSEEYTNTLAYSTDHVDITSSAGPKLQMNGGARFRYYGTSQQVLQLYKYNPDAEVVAYTYCTNPACTPRYRVTMNSATGGSPSADKVYEHADETITLTANPSSGYSFTSWTITKTTGGDNVTSTLLTGDKPTTANTTFTMPAYDITIAATYTKKMVSTLEVKDGATVVSTTTGPVSGTVNISTGANKTLDVVITPSDAYDHSWTATVSAGSTYASITNVTDDGFRVNGLAQGDATITVNAPNDGSAKSVTLTVQVRDIMPEEIILKRDGSNTPIETLIMFYDETNSKGQYVKVNVGYSPANPTNKAFTFSSALTGKVGSHSHAPASGYEVLVANGVTSDAVNCTFTSSADGSVTKVLAVTVLPILTDRFVDYIQGNATQTVSARLSADRYDIITDINTPSLSDASDADPTSEDCKTAHYHLIGWLPQATAEALWAAGTAITESTEGLVRAGTTVEATGQTWYAIWAKEE